MDIDALKNEYVDAINRIDAKIKSLRAESEAAFAAKEWQKGHNIGKTRKQYEQIRDDLLYSLNEMSK